MKASITDLGRPVLYSLLASVLLVAGTLVFAALAATSASRAVRVSRRS